MICGAGSPACLESVSGGIPAPNRFDSSSVIPHSIRGILLPVTRLFSDLPKPMVVAHRGACGLLPEHTIPAFEVAIRQGTAAIELDVVPTRDGVLIARHESELSLTTNVATDRSFSQYRTQKLIEGHPVEGWFTTDLMLEQIQRLGRNASG